MPLYNRFLLAAIVFSIFRGTTNWGLSSCLILNYLPWTPCNPRHHKIAASICRVICGCELRSVCPVFDRIYITKSSSWPYPIFHVTKLYEARRPKCSLGRHWTPFKNIVLAPFLDMQRGICHFRFTTPGSWISRVLYDRCFQKW